MNDKERIQEIIKRTFKVIKNVYDNQREGNGGKGSKRDYCGSQSRIIFPQYSNGETRISEQELRFIFVEQFNKYCQEESWNAYYSVETPTKIKYVFSEKGSKVNPRVANENKKEGQSAMVDLCIHDASFNRIALIEFKALNPGKAAYAKDFCKLSHEPTSLTFFIMIIENHNDGTIPSIQEKIKTKGADTEFYCYDLKEGQDISTKIIKDAHTSSK